MAEFAVAFPLQLFLVFGILQLGLIFYGELMVNYAAFRAARAAVVGEDAARAAVIVLAPVTGSAHEGCRYWFDSNDSRPVHQPGCADAGAGVTIPGWGLLRGSDLAWGGEAGGKARVYVNGHLVRPDTSWAKVVDADAFDDEARFGGARESDRRKELLNALARPLDGQDREDVNVVVEFDYELTFPIVDAFWALFFRAKGAAEDAGEDAVTAEKSTVYGDLDADPPPPESTLYRPGAGFREGVARVRRIGGAYHLVIARECTMYRGFGPP